MPSWSDRIICCCMYSQAYCLKGVDLGIAALGPVLFIFAVCIISGLTYTYFNCMSDVALGQYSLQWFLVTAVGLWFLFNLSFNYIMCVLTSPGYTRELPVCNPPLCVHTFRKHKSTNLTHFLFC